jgi:hypothetical protein
MVWKIVASRSLTPLHSEEGAPHGDSWGSAINFLSEGCNAILREKPSKKFKDLGGVKLCQRMKFKYLKYSLYTTFSKEGGKML